MLNLQQKQTLQQRLSPQQIQYIKLLQLPTLALEQRIKTELEINPLLEEGEDDPDELTDTTTDETTSDEESTEEPGDKEDQEYQWEELLDNADDLYGYKARVDHSADEDRRELPMPAMESVLEKLRNQLAFLDLAEEEQLIADQIIGSIDEDGYLRRPPESIIDDIAFNQGVILAEEDVERVLKRIQLLDPIGIASRDLQECLLVQLESMEEETLGREAAILMLQRAYKEFTMKHYEAIMRRLRIDSEELKEAFDLVRRLDPKPGEGAFSAAQNYITPDFSVQNEEEEFLISVNSGNTPQLRVSKSYRQMLEQIVVDKRRGKGTYDSETRHFLKTKFESARWFINSINQRRQTMMKVMQAIVHRQEEFFKLGEGHLKPMILKDIAEMIRMDISTISRVVNGKYVQSDFGVYELKYFFSEGLSTESGEEVSNKEVKAIIDGIIAEEDKYKPLSDQRIATVLS
ncbi:MAG: RNA polymerase factor sigma-54, partial [Bacteroidetes bacterium]|nr:RNA polymerase factor sigma-54 [Bacteroidota bacterium]